MKKKKEPDEASVRGELGKAFARWNALACGECADPGWEDGVNMNLVRNHILYYYRQRCRACIYNDRGIHDFPCCHCREAGGMTDYWEWRGPQKGNGHD